MARTPNSTLHLLPGLDLVPGARVDEYRPSSGLPGSAAFAVDPKLAARLTLSARVTAISTMGVAHQEPSYVLPIPGVKVTSTEGLQSVYSMAEGVEVHAPWDLKVRFTGFLDADRNVSDFVATCGAVIQCNSVASVNGRTYGLELLVQRALTHRLGGWLSYTLSRAERTVGTTPYLSPFDRTHVLTAIVHYDFGHGYGGGARFTYYSGRPDIPTVSLSGPSPTYAFAPGQMPQHRLPDYYRFDFRVDKRWRLGSHELADGRGRVLRRDPDA